MRDGRTAMIRPIRPEDEPLALELWNSFSEGKWQYRFFDSVKKVTHEDVVRYTNVDYRRNMTLVAKLNEDGEKIVGICGIEIDPRTNSGQFGIVIGEPWKGLGLGEKLLDSIIGIAKDKGLKEVWTNPPKEMDPMRGLCKKLGFEIEEKEETFLATLTI